MQSGPSDPQPGILRSRRSRLPRNSGPKLDPLTEAGRGTVQEMEKAWLREVISKLNALFEGDLTDQDMLVYANNVIKGKLLESKKLRQQASGDNTKEQFASSPDLDKALADAIMDALDAHRVMSTQAHNSAKVRAGLKDILLNDAGSWESLRAASPPSTPASPSSPSQIN